LAPFDPALWVMDTFVEEVGAVREALGLDRVHLLGHSWGGWLALQYALGRPAGLVSLILASTCTSLPAFGAETWSSRWSRASGERSGSSSSTVPTWR
jgi:pimeloyl-ACP methyl ester carboxylesterase